MMMLGTEQDDSVTPAIKRKRKHEKEKQKNKKMNIELQPEENDVIQQFPVILIDLATLKNAKEKMTDDNSELSNKLRSHANKIKSESIIGSFDNFRSEFMLLCSSPDFGVLFSFKLPVLYRSADMISAIDEVLHPVWKMTIEFKFPKLSRKSAGTGESTLIWGPVGVGKTTIQISLMVLLYLLTDTTLPVYVEYTAEENSEARLPINLICSYATKLNILTNSVNFTTSNVLQRLHENHRMVVLFCDEIQRLYQVKENTLARNIIGQIAQIGKTVNHIGVASGSSHNLTSFAFNPKTHGFTGYHTLNNSVYVPTHIIPCRNELDFAHLMSSKSNSSLSRDELIKHFLNSGGVGRIVDRIFSMNAVLTIPSDYFSNAMFYSIMGAMILKVRHLLSMESIDSWDPWKAPHAVSKISCIAVVKILGYTITEFEKLLEDSLLLQINDRVELLQPGILVAVYKTLESSNSNRFEDMAFEGTLLGRSDGGGSFPSARHCNEEPIRRMLAKAEEKNYQKINIENDDALGHLNTWYQGVSNFTEIDGFLLEDDEANNIIEVSLSQIITGKMTTTIELGAACQKYSFRSFLKGFSTGFEKLKRMFRKEDQSRLRLKRVVFLTTKLFAEECRNFMNEPTNFEVNGTAYEFELWDCEAILKNVEISSIVMDSLKKR